jgi:hypothetical protein
LPLDAAVLVTVLAIGLYRFGLLLGGERLVWAEIVDIRG